MVVDVTVSTCEAIGVFVVVVVVVVVTVLVDVLNRAVPMPVLVG